MVSCALSAMAATGTLSTGDGRNRAFYDKRRRIGWQWQAMDGKTYPAPCGSDETERNPTDRGYNYTDIWELLTLEHDHPHIKHRRRRGEPKADYQMAFSG